MKLGDGADTVDWGDHNFGLVLLVVVVSAGLSFAACDEPEQTGPEGSSAQEGAEQPVMDDEGRPHFEDVAEEAAEAEAEEAARAAEAESDGQQEAEQDEEAEDEGPDDEDAQEE